jgi:predicted RNase H-like nuclease (RuvC/YqgF family)
MQPVFRKLIWAAGLVISLGASGYGQSLGDVAREQRQKQEAKKAQAAPKVITNEDLPEHPESNDSAASSQANGESAPSHPMGSKSAEQWKAEIAAQQRSVDNLQSQIDRLNSSIHFAPGNCVRNCVQWNERQIQKQDEVQGMQAELEQQKKRLEEMQEAARKEGFGNAVYEP